MTTHKTLGVIGAYTGILMGPFGDVHEVFDAVYPGIMTIGIMAMGDSIKPILLGALPGLSAYTQQRIEKNGWQKVAADAVAEFGESVDMNLDSVEIDPLRLEMETLASVNPGAHPIIVEVPS